MISSQVGINIVFLQYDENINYNTESFCHQLNENKP